MYTRGQQDLDNYITGHWGEDQFRGQDEAYSVHREYCDNRSLDGVYDYDLADDGPECEVITRVLAHHHVLGPRLPEWLGKVDA